MTTINVTAEHIAKGTPRECRFCPVALAVKDAFPHDVAVSIGHRYISMYSHERHELLPIPEDVRGLIAAIDAGRPVEPFTFDLDYPAVATS